MNGAADATTSPDVRGRRRFEWGLLFDVKDRHGLVHEGDLESEVREVDHHFAGQQARSLCGLPREGHAVALQRDARLASSGPRSGRDLAEDDVESVLSFLREEFGPPADARESVDLR